MSDVIKIEGLSKSFGKKSVLKHMTVEINAGRVIGVLGENGIGKTTLLELMAGILKPDNGYIDYGDIGLSKNVREYVSILLEPGYFYTWMRIKDAVKFYKDFFKDFDVDLALNYFNSFNMNLENKIKSLSKGDKEKVSIILNLSRKTSIYLLDEPAGGFDPKFKKEILRLILASMNENRTIIISTHLLKDMENIFDDVLILNKTEPIYISCDTIRESFGKSVENYYLEVTANA